VHDLDLGSVPGQALARAVEARHGAGLVAAAQFATRLILLRSAWAPGLRFVGGQVEGGRTGLAGAKAEVLSLAGGGETLEDAFASCMGEGVERLAQYERPGDVVSLPVGEARSRVMPEAMPLVMQQLQPAGLADPAVVDWLPAKMLGSGQETLVPADWCLRRPSPGPLRDPSAALSTGTAAGPDPARAEERAMLELIERDAASLWWEGGRRGRPLAFDRPAAREATRVLSVLRGTSLERATWLLDITTDIAVPVVAAISVGRDGRGLCCGLAARIHLADAARAAITELCQMEVGLLIARAKRESADGPALGEIDLRHLARAERIDADSCALLHPLGAPRCDDDPPPQDAAMRLQRLLDRLGRSGISVALVDLTRPEIGITVSKAIAPRLQPLPSSMVTDRLRDTLASTGGGARWTGGIALS
jgi:ribosomal protein S12 methylthiotransferase accessory factor